MNMNPKFTFDYIEQNYSTIIDQGYKIVTCEQYARNVRSPDGRKRLINRVDIDLNAKKAEQLGIIFNKLGIKASFFIRLHAPQYNPNSFEIYRIVKFLKDSGHEIGLHSEIVDLAAIWGEDEVICLKRDVETINSMFDFKIAGVASHGGMTGLNNLDFWKNRQPQELGLFYEAYDWFDDTFYISDSEWTQWKCYDHGKLVAGDRRSLAEHAQDGHQLIYALIHSDTYYNRHIYE